MWTNISFSASATSSPRGRLLNRIDGHENINDGPTQTSPKRSAGSPLMRYKHAVCSASSGYIYIYGGRFGNLPLDDDVWRFDPHQNSWLQLETTGFKPPSLQEHTLVEYNEHLYLFGGQVSTSSMENSFWRLDLVNNEWHSMNIKSSKFGAYLGPTNRRGHSAVIYDDSMYIFGGFEDFRGSSAQLWEFDLINERWELRNLSSSSARHPEPRYSHSAIVHRDSMYIYGGLSNLKPLNDLWRWCWRERRWSKVRTRGKSPGYLHGHSAIQAFDSMFVFGGERKGYPSRSLWRLNLNNLVWQKIRAKGPRPDPTTWHGAIANPLSILDEANYIIEGDPELLKDSPMSDRSCVIASPQYQDESIRYQASERDQGNGCSSSSGKPIASQLTHSKSSSAEMNAGLLQASKGAPGLERSKLRSLRLSFLRRRQRSSKSEARRISNLRSSASCANNLGSSTMIEQDVDIEQSHVDSRGNFKILDNLDTDIKEMFHQALGDTEESKMSDLSTSTKNEADSNLRTIEDNPAVELQRDTSTLTSSESNYLTAIGRTQTESSNLNVRSSQRTSCAYATPKSGLSSTTLKDCDQQFSSGQSSFNIRGAAGGLTSGWLAEVVSQQQQQQQQHSNGARDRPKSEILQSLIDRADARIKHLYTPFFQSGQTDPKIANRLSSSGRSHRRDASNFRNRRNGSSTLMDKSKRHTIHQTMTYYNLYFSEASKPSSNDDNDLDDAMSVDHQTQQPGELIIQNSEINGDLGASDRSEETPMQTYTMTRDDSSSSTIKDRFFSGSGTLIGVRGASTVNTDQESLATQSSDSRTIRGDLKNESIVTITPPENQSGNGISNEGIEDKGSQKPESIAADSSCDNTSMSFSVIAEFEEDDMLQYSSPTDPVIRLDDRAEGISLSQRRSNDSYGLQMDHDYRPTQNEIPQLDEKSPSLSAKSKQRQLIMAHKSASSGYDSISGSYEQPATQRSQMIGYGNLQGDLRGDHNNEGSSLGGGSSSEFATNETSPENVRSHSKFQNGNGALHNKDQIWTRTVKQLKDIHSGDCNDLNAGNCRAGTETSSTTADSMALEPSERLDRQPNLIASKHLPSRQEHSDKKLASYQQIIHPKSDTQTSISVDESHRQIGRQMSRGLTNWPLVSKSRFFSRQKSRNRYWQLCMFVIGGKQGGTNSGNEPITIWRLYI